MPESKEAFDIFLSHNSTTSPAPYKYHSFISYSMDPDYSMVRKMESFLESFHKLKTPAEIELKPLQMCVDGSDFSIQKIKKKDGKNAVAAIIESYLEQSEELLVMCSAKSAASPWVNLEICWFLENRGTDAIRLAVTEGTNPTEHPEEVFSPSIIEAKLHKKPWYDFRETRGKEAKNWVKVKNFEDERCRLAADLNNVSSGEVQPIWYRQQRRTLRKRIGISAATILLLFIIGAVAINFSIVAKKEEGLKYVSDAYKLLYREPSKAVIKAYLGYSLLPRNESEEALRTAFKVASLHHHNRRENNRITGSGPSYLASRWKQGDVFSEVSPDGRYQLLVTERGKDGSSPPGEVYLMNNETLKVTKVEPCIGRVKRRVEDVSFDTNSNTFFITRQFELSVYSAFGRCIGGYKFSRHTKSPVHLVEGYVNGKYVLGSESKGGLWLVVPDKGNAPPKKRKKPITLQREFHGDPALSARLSSDSQKAVIIFESGRSAVLLFDPTQDKYILAEMVLKNTLFAGFVPGDDSKVVTTGADGIIRTWQITGNTVREIQAIQVSTTSLDWITISDDNKYMLAAGENQALHVVDAEEGKVIANINYTQEIDWAAARAIGSQKEHLRPRSNWRKPEIKLLGDPEFKVDKILTVGEETWLVSPMNDEENSKGKKIYRVEGEKALHYSAFPANASSVSKLGDYYRFNRGPLYKFNEDSLNFYAEKDLAIRDTVQIEDSIWLGTNKGLYRIQEEQITRFSDEKLIVKRLYNFAGRLYILTEKGLFLKENELIIQISDQFVKIRDIKYVAGRIWILTTSTEMHAGGGPLFVLDGYFTRRVGDLSWRVEDVFEIDGKTWISTSNNFYMYDGSEFKAVSGIEHIVTFIEKKNDKILLKTRSKGLLKHREPVYQLDIKKCTAVPLKYKSRLWKVYGKDTLAFKDDNSTIMLGELEPEVMKLSGQREIAIDLEGNSVQKALHVDGKTWLGTTGGVYQLERNRAVKITGLDLPVIDIRTVAGDIWILSTNSVHRRKGNRIESFTIANTCKPREIKEAAGTIWILTTNDGGLPGPAYRFEHDKLIKTEGPTGAIRDIATIGNVVWALTSSGDKAGPLYKISL